MPVLKSPAWRNWQTRWTQNPVAARPCGFEPLRRQLFIGCWPFDVRVLVRDQSRLHRRGQTFAPRPVAGILCLCARELTTMFIREREERRRGCRRTAGVCNYPVELDPFGRALRE